MYQTTPIKFPLEFQLSKLDFPWVFCFPNYNNWNRNETLQHLEKKENKIPNLNYIHTAQNPAKPCMQLYGLV